MSETQNLPTREQTFGEKAVGLQFNPGNFDAVTNVKQRYANLIDELDQLRKTTEDGEVKRMCSVTITELQTCQMWHVKTLTWR